MKYCQSYVEMVERNTRLALSHTGMGMWSDYPTVRDAVEALANIRLAVEEDELVDPATTHCTELYMQLVEAGACQDGLTTVGHWCTYHTLDNVLAHREDWRAWYEENVLDALEPGEDEPDNYPHFDTYDEVNA